MNDKGCKYIKDEINGDGECEYGTKILCEECKYCGLGGRKDPQAKCNQED